MSYTNSTDCSSVASRSNISIRTYADAIRRLPTNYSQTLTDCKKEICSAFFSTGNTDISGIGAVVGYALCGCLGFILSAICTWLPANPINRHHRSLRKALESYQSSARVFSISLQLVMVIFHARRDLGRGSSGDGALETEIGWNISLITMLALLYSLAVPRKFVEREGFNFSIVCGVWALHCYIFYSRCKDNWGPSITDEGIIRPQEWDIIVKACYPPGDVGGLLGRDHYLLNICAMIGSLGASIVVIGRVVYLVIEPVDTTVLTGAISKWLRISDVPKAWMGLRRVVCLVLFPLITGTQFFAIIQIRRRQRRLAMHIGAEFVDDQWGFGQVVAVVVWVLVLIDYGYAYIFGK